MNFAIDKSYYFCDPPIIDFGATKASPTPPIIHLLIFAIIKKISFDFNRFTFQGNSHSMILHNKSFNNKNIQ